jgi:hypothetical protein
MTAPKRGCSGSCYAHSYDRTGRLRHHRIPFRVVEADSPTPLPQVAARVLHGLRLAARRLATPPGTPVRSDAAAAVTDGTAAGEPSGLGSWGCTCGTCHCRPHLGASARRSEQRPAWQPPENTRSERPVLIDGVPIDPLAFDADPDAFLRAVFGPTYGEAS